MVSALFTVLPGKGGNCRFELSATVVIATNEVKKTDSVINERRIMFYVPKKLRSMYQKRRLPPNCQYPLSAGVPLISIPVASVALICRLRN